ncbi:MAG TPA: hypothetical protein VGG19_17240 [Tepidisphaeraceae bacterium]|jgi:plastocyanin
MRRLRIFLVLGISLLGCDKATKPETVQTVSPGTATIRGVVNFVGTPPVMNDIPNAVCGATQQNIPQESILVGPHGGLRNCLVFLKDVSSLADTSSKDVLLDQVNCRYVPHVLGVMVGQNLAIKSEDATPHNVHLQTAVNPPANFAMVQPGQQTITHFDYPEIFKVTCDVHPWMAAWVGVFSSPYFAVTDANGQFEIQHVPAGTYILEVWQERLGIRQQSIHISDHETLQQNFSYAPSADAAGG